MHSIVNQGAKREYSWATRPMSNEEWRWKAPDLSVSYNCPSTYLIPCLKLTTIQSNVFFFQGFIHKTTIRFLPGFIIKLAPIANSLHTQVSTADLSRKSIDLES